MPTLAQMVRSKYPGAYDDFSDTDLEAKIDAKYPGAYDDIERTQRASAEAPVRYNPADYVAAPSLPRGVDAGPGAAVGLAGLAGIGAMAAGPAVAGAAARVVGPRAAGMLKGAAIGAGTDLALGGSPKSAAVAAVLGAAGLEPLAKGGKAVAQAVARKVLAKTAAEAAAPVAAKVASKGVEVAAKHNALMQFAKQVAQRNPKVGEKIWILLDEAGNPSKLLTPDQAGAAARKGLSTTWVKNLWAN